MRIELHYFPGDGVVPRDITGLNGATFTNVQTLVNNGFVFTIPTGKTSVNVCFLGYPDTGMCGGGVNLDIDDLSLNDYTAP
jgi:hypothetical protein